MNYKKIAYIGAGEDLNPLNLFPTSDFVYIDSLPRNQSGYPYYDRGFYHANFKRDIKTKLSRLGFEIVTFPNESCGLFSCLFPTTQKRFTRYFSEINVPHLESHLVQFERPNQRLRYYFSTGIPQNIYNDELNTTLTTDLSDCDAILVSGHWPDRDVVEFMTKPFHFIGGSDTYFPERHDSEQGRNLEEVKRTILAFISNPANELASYSYWNKKENTLHTFSTYQEFYQFYQDNKHNDEEA